MLFRSANVDLKPALAFALGRATAHHLVGAGGSLVVGQDTRRSCDMLVAAITAGATSLGVDVHLAGVMPTPALAFLAGSGAYRAGIMVSASHNPADDNGLKVLDAEGRKLDDEVEDALEHLIWRADELAGPGLLKALDALDARSRRIVEERWLKVNDDASGGMTLHELAAEYGVSAERIRQIEVAALKKMRKALEAA